jgi:ribonuclease HII
MHRAIDNLKLKDSINHLLIDGSYFIEYEMNGISIPYTTITKGDSLYVPISCASILAKEAHDEYINELCDKYQELEEYGLRKNVGYGTKEHMDAINRLGITEFHRKSFAPCKNKKMNNLLSINN